MNPEARFVLAIVLMLAVLVGTSMLFGPPPPPPEEEPVPERVVEEEDLPTPPPDPAEVVREPAEAPAPRIPGLEAPAELPEVTPAEEAVTETLVEVSGPLFRYTLSTRGARVRSAELVRFESFVRPGPVELVAEDDPGLFGSRIVVEGDTVDLRGLEFSVDPEEGLRLEAGGAPRDLTFVYRHPDQPFEFEVRYTFHPDAYLFDVTGRARGLERGLLLTDMGRGLALNEADIRDDIRAMAYVANHLQNGVRSQDLADVDRARVDNGPFRWAAVKSRYFLVALLPALELGGAEHLGGVVVRPLPEREVPAVEVAVTQSLQPGGGFAYRVFAGPQDYGMLSALGHDLQEVSPIGWRFLRPILRPFVGIIMWILIYLHETLAIGYGWVLILFGIMMRVVLFPLYHKSMKAQLRNMAVQPLLKEIQTKYKDQPEKMQKELMRLYKEHGFNPLAGCWPMLLPWPILIALFFVFQNTIEFRGVPFWWLPDLSGKDPFFVLPVLLGISMFLMQWISFRTLDEINPQMKMMMWLLPIFMVVLFANFPSGLNLYYLTANIATLPQSWWIANERQKVKAKGPPAPARA